MYVHEFRGDEGQPLKEGIREGSLEKMAFIPSCGKVLSEVWQSCVHVCKWAAHMGRPTWEYDGNHTPSFHEGV